MTRPIRLTGVTQDPQRGRVPAELPLPQDRPTKSRSAVRVIVRADDHVLLFEDSDPAYAEIRWWVTPGGGIDPGETPEQAAVREVEEETGLRVLEHELIGPLSTRVAVHGYSDQILEQAECFYLVQVERFDVDISCHTADEQITLQSHRWWPLAELERTDAWIWPRYLTELVGLAAQPPSRPVDYGREIDESTLAV